MRKSLALCFILLLIFGLLLVENPFKWALAVPSSTFPLNFPQKGSPFGNSSLTSPGTSMGDASYWTKVYGWSRGEFALSSTISSGDIILAGYTNSLGSQTDDALLVKIKPDGSVLWGKLYSGEGSDQTYCISRNPAGGFLGVGATSSYGAGNFDLLIFNTDPEGNLGSDFPGTWARTIGGAGYDQATAVCPSGGDGFFISGFTYSYGAGGCDVLTLKLSSLGSIEWLKTFGGSSNDYGFSSCRTSDGNYYIVGSTASFGSSGFDFLVIKLRPDGSLSWAKRLGGNFNDEPRAVIPLPEGGIIVGGSSSSFGFGGKDLLLMKLSSEGSLEWVKVLGGSLDEEIFGLSTGPEEILIAGYTSSWGCGNKDLFVLAFDPNGNLLWGKTFGGTGDDFARAIAFDPQVGIVVSGNSASFGFGEQDCLALKLDLSGEIPGASCQNLKTWTPSTAIPNLYTSTASPTIKIPSWSLLNCPLGSSPQEIPFQVICQSPPSYSLSIEVNPSGSGTVLKDPDLPLYLSGTKVTLTASPLEHYHFQEWTGDVTGTSSVVSLMMDSSKNVTANFSPDIYTVTFDKNGGDSDPIPAFKEVPYGSCLDSLPQPPTKVGHAFIGWNTSPDGLGSWFDLNSPILQNLTLFAQWKKNVYRLSVSVEGVGEVSIPEGECFEFGSAVSLKAIPSPGFQFLKWKGDVPQGKEKDNPLTLVMDSDKNLSAVFSSIGNPVPMPSLSLSGLFVFSTLLIIVSLLFL